MARSSWLDDESQEIKIDDYAKELESFLTAMEDGRIDESELESQEKRIVEHMKVVEPMLDDDTHAKVTELLAEMTAFSTMQMLHELDKRRPKTAFRG